MLRTDTSIPSWACDSCKHRPIKGPNGLDRFVMVDIDENDLEVEQYYLCRDCAERLHQQLGDILGHTPKEIETASILDYTDKFIAESDLLEMTLPDGTIIRATKFGEDLEDE